MSKYYDVYIFMEKQIKNFVEFYVEPVYKNVKTGTRRVGVEMLYSSVR